MQIMTPESDRIIPEPDRTAPESDRTASVADRAASVADRADGGDATGSEGSAAEPVLPSAGIVPTSKFIHDNASRSFMGSVSEAEPGRPADPAGRSERELRVYDLLDALGISYKRVDHPHTATMEECRGIDTILGVGICKNLFLCNRQQTDFYLLLMPGEKPFKTKELSHQLGCSRLSFGSGEKMAELLDVYPGAATVMALMNDRENRVRLLIDSDLLLLSRFACHPCENTSSIVMSTEDMLRVFLPAVRHSFTAVTLTGEG